MATFVSSTFPKSDQELSGLFCIMCEKTVHIKIQDRRNQRAPKSTRVPGSLEFIVQAAFDDQNLISVGLTYSVGLVE